MSDIVLRGLWVLSCFIKSLCTTKYHHYRLVFDQLRIRESEFSLEIEIVSCISRRDGPEILICQTTQSSSIFLWSNLDVPGITAGSDPYDLSPAQERDSVAGCIKQYTTVRAVLSVEKQCLFFIVVAAGDFGCCISLVVRNNVYQCLLFF